MDQRGPDPDDPQSRHYVYKTEDVPPIEEWSSVVTKQQHRSRGRLLAILALAQHLLQYTSLMFPKSLSNNLTDPVCDVAYLGTWVLGKLCS